MNAARYVFVPISKANRQDITDNNQRMNRWHDLRRYLAHGLARRGSREMTLKILGLCRRLAAATLRNVNGKIPAEFVTRLLERADDSDQDRSDQTRRFWMRFLRDMNLVETGYGWVRWLGLENRLVLLDNSLTDERLGKSNLRSESPSEPENAGIVSRCPLESLAEGKASACGANVFSKKQRTRGPSGPGRHAQRGSRGRFTAAPSSQPDRSKGPPAEFEVPAESASKSLSEPNRLQTRTDLDENMASIRAQEIAQCIADPDLATLVANLIDAATARDAKREAEGLPPLEQQAPKPKPKVVLMRNGLPAPPSAPPAACFAQPDDRTLADVTWLQFSLGGCPALSKMNWASAARERYSRGDWRQAVAALVSLAPGVVGDAPAYLRGCLKTRREQPSTDPRTRPGYFVLDSWGQAAINFSGWKR